MNAILWKSGFILSAFVTASSVYSHGWLMLENKVKSTAAEARDTYARRIVERAGFDVKPKVDLDQFIEERAATCSIDSNLVRALIFAESNFNSTAVSSTGAIGLMQILPSTAKLFGYTSDEMADPYKNVTVGVKHLCGDLKAVEWNAPKAIERYTCGPEKMGCAEGVAHARNVLTIATSRGSKSWNAKKSKLVSLGDSVF